MSHSQFEWDPRKNEANLLKHGVSFFEAQKAFADPRRIIAEDLSHSGQEMRYYCFGATPGGILTVRYTWRNGRIRIIGAGYWREGKAVYAEKNKIQR